MRGCITAFERREREHAGITADVNQRFLDGMTGEEMLGYLSETYKITDIPLSTIYYHRLTRTMAWKQQVQEQKAAYSAMAELVDEKGLDDVAKARLWEAVQTMPPELLIRMRAQQIERENQVLVGKQLEHKNRELELKLKQLEEQHRKAEEAIEQASEKLGKGESLTVEDINRIRERTFGLPAVAADARG